MREAGSFGPARNSQASLFRFEIRRRSLPLAAGKQMVVSSRCFVHCSLYLEEHSRTCCDLTQVSLTAEASA